MIKFLKILPVLVLTVFAAPAFSDMVPAVSVVADKLADQGYQVSSISTTFLGRVKIVAQKDEREREVILNPNTGEILRDLVRRLRQRQGSDDSGPGGQGTASASDEDISDDGDSDRDDGHDSSESDDPDESDESESSDSSDSSDEPDD